VRDHHIITANSTAPLEFAKEVMITLEIASESKILERYNFYKSSYYQALNDNPIKTETSSCVFSPEKKITKLCSLVE